MKANTMISPTLELVPLPNFGLLSSARAEGSDAPTQVSNTGTQVSNTGTQVSNTGTQVSNTAFPHSTDTQFWMGSDNAGDA